MIDESCVISAGAKIPHPALVNLYGCFVEDGCMIGPFVEIQRGVSIGARVHVCSHTMIGGGAQIGSDVFIGHGVVMGNDLYPVMGQPTRLKTLIVEDGASIGNGAMVLPVRIGHHAIVGAGAVVTRDVPALAVVVGNPARIIRTFASVEERNAYIRAKQVEDE